ncbi:hypothetical protein EBH_0078340 [Eimeria brunetti]|uniref:Uncharacterized protein n=1 Tax=Eimeria brunetti TaxID=51314 RepID=U6LGG2_9EIME|nr:hypothetical protein EBH_0078340 [Eimeria brunetti]
MPKTLRPPIAVYEDPSDGKKYTRRSRNRIELMQPQYHGWPFAPYCTQAVSPDGCSALANAFFYWGNGEKKEQQLLLQQQQQQQQQHQQQQQRQQQKQQ